MQSRYIFITVLTLIGLFLFLSLTTPLFADNPVGDINDPAIVVANSATSKVDVQAVTAPADPPVIEPADGPPYYIFLPLIHKTFRGWKELSSGITNTINAVSCPRDNNQDCVIVGPGFARYTNDGGKTWTPATTDLSAYVLYEVSCSSPTLCMTVGKINSGGGVILVSNTGGATWWVAKNESREMYGVDCFGNFCLAVGKEAWITGSSDGGNTWSGGDIGTPDLVDTYCLGESTCWMVGDSSRLFGIYPGGLIPKQDLKFPYELYAISCVDSHNCVTVGEARGTGDAIIIKTDNGWRNKSFPASNVAVNLNGVSCPTATDCYAVGNGGTVLVSIDDGNTWSPDTTISPIPTENLNDIYCLPGTLTCYVVGAGGKIYYHQ